MDNRNIRLFTFAFMFFLVSTSFVMAFGISAPYWNDNPLRMFPGETKEISFNLQNCPSLLDICDKSDETVTIMLEQGEEIATIISGNNYDLPYGSADQYVRLKVEIPSNADLGERYNIVFSAISTPDVEGGNIQVGIKYNVNFPVIVGEKFDTLLPVSDEASERAAIGFIVVIVIIILALVAIVIWLLIKLLRRKS